MAQEHPIVVRELTVCNPDGLYSRAAAKLIRVGQAYDATLTFECRKQRVQAKSIMALLSLDAEQGTAVTAIAEGPEAETMIQAVERLFANGFRDPDRKDGRTAELVRKAERSSKGSTR